MMPDVVAELQHIGELPTGMSDEQASQFLQAHSLPTLLQCVGIIPAHPSNA